VKSSIKYGDLLKYTEELRGIIQGISIDYKLTSTEINKLQEWLDLHKNLHNKEPFLSLTTLLKRCLADQRIDENEHEEILEWCLDFVNDSPFGISMTESIDRLKNILIGISLDKSVTKEELEELHDWLYDYEKYKSQWPFCETWSMLTRILEDGEVDLNEQKEVITFCNNFLE
jgi:hypothetical protein